MFDHEYSFMEVLTPKEEEFFSLVEICDYQAVQKFLTNNPVNINMKNYQGITPLHLAIQNDCEPLVNLFLSQKGIRIGDSILFTIAHDNLQILDKLFEFKEKNSGDNVYDANDTMTTDSEEFPSFMTPLMLAAQCGRYETVEYLLSHGHELNRPHPPRCSCEVRCMTAIVDIVADGCERLNAYRAISDPSYLCCSSASDPILACFLLHDELLECGSVDQVYKTVYTAMAQQVRQFAVEMVVNCRTSDEVKVMLWNRSGCKFRGKFPYPRLITAMDYNQKEFVAHTNIQQMLESAWIGKWIDWKAYSTLQKCAYPFWRLFMMPVTVIMGVLIPNSRMNESNRLPINRMFNSLVMYVVFLVLLFMQSNEDKFKTPRGVPNLYMWVPIAIFVLGYAYEKIKLRLLQGPERFFKNLWNGFDTIKLVLFTVAYLCWIVAEVQTQFVSDDLDRKYWHWADPQLIAEGLFAAATVMAYMRLLFLCQLNYYIGPMQVSLGKVLRDFGKFTTFLIIIMVAFTSGLGTLYGYYKGMVQKDPETDQVIRQEYSFVTVPDTFKTLFWGIFCMTSLEAPNVIIENNSGSGNADGPETHQHHFTQLVGYGLFAVFEVLMVIVMLNMLIAAMSDTFQRVADNAEYEWLFGRTEVYVNYMLLDDLPPPFNLLPTLNTLIAIKNGLLASSGHGCLDNSDDNEQYDSIEFRALNSELIKRYFTHKAQMNRSY